MRADASPRRAGEEGLVHEPIRARAADAYFFSVGRVDDLRRRAAARSSSVPRRSPSSSKLTDASSGRDAPAAGGRRTPSPPCGRDRRRPSTRRPGPRRDRSADTSSSTIELEGLVVAARRAQLSASCDEIDASHGSASSRPRAAPPCRPSRSRPRRPRRSSSVARAGRSSRSRSNWSSSKPGRELAPARGSRTHPALPVRQLVGDHREAEVRDERRPARRRASSRPDRRSRRPSGRGAGEEPAKQLRERGEVDRASTHDRTPCRTLPRRRTRTAPRAPGIDISIEKANRPLSAAALVLADRASSGKSIGSPPATAGRRAATAARRRPARASSNTARAASTGARHAP